MGREKRESRKFFWSAFVLTMSVLMLIMVGTVLAVQPALQREEPRREEPAYRPPAEDSLTLAVIGRAKGEKQARQFLLIRFNPQYGQVPLTVLPSQSLVLLEGERMTLSDAFAKKGGQGVKQALAERFGIGVDRYAVIDGSAFVRVAAKTGTVVYTLPYAVSYDRDGFPVNIPEGERRLDGQDLLDLFGAPALQADPEEKSRLLGEICAEAVNQNLEAAGSDTASGLFKLAVNLVDTDVTSRDFELRRGSAEFMANLKVTVSASLPAKGTMLGDGVSFELQEEYVELVQKYFPRDGTQN